MLLDPFTAVSGSFLPRMRFDLTSHHAAIRVNNVLANMTCSWTTFWTDPFMGFCILPSAFPCLCCHSRFVFECQQFLSPEFG